LLFAAKTIFGALEFFATVILSLSLFRIPFKYKISQVILMTLLMGVISTYFRDVLVAPDFVILPVLVSEIILITLIFSLPIYYSLLICVIGFLSAIIFETLFTVIGSGIGITSQELISTSFEHYITAEIVCSILMFICTYIIFKTKIGFLFIMKHLSLKQALRGYNFILSAILLIGLIFAHIALFAYTDLQLNIYFPIGLFIIFLLGLLIAYKHNKKVIKMKYERLTKK
jgi:hypothetical protein